MCDTIVKKNLSEKEIPQFVWKRVQKIGEGRYVSPVMGEPMKVGEWKKAPKRPRLAKQGYTDMVDYIKRAVRKKYGAGSSAWTAHHDGMWGVFKLKKDAQKADLISNFVDKKDAQYPTVVVRCEIKGIVHSSQFDGGDDTFLASHIKIVGEVGKAR